MTDTRVRHSEGVVGFDHVVIGSRHLERSQRAFEHAGFQLAGGGVHMGRGTANELVRLRSGYLEVLTVVDRQEAMTFGGSRRQAAEFLDVVEAGLLGFAMAVSDLAECRKRLHRAGVATSGPHAMTRRQPDGREVSWRTLLIEDRQWRSPFPFLIEWDGEGHSWAGATSAHPNGVSGVSGVVVSAGDLDRAIQVYRALGATDPVRGESGFRLVLAGLSVEIRHAQSAAEDPGHLTSVTLGGQPTQEFLEQLMSGPLARWMTCVPRQGPESG